MLRMAFPPTVTVLIAEVAKVLRFSFPTVENWLIESIPVGNAHRYLTAQLELNGYEHTSILLNLSIFVAIFALTLISLVIAKCLDSTYVTDVLSQPLPNGRTEVRRFTSTQKVSNVMFRLLLASFLEFFICILVNIKTVSASQSSFLPRFAAPLSR